MKTIFNLRTFIHKISFSSVEVKIHIFIPQTVISSTVCTVCNKYRLFSNKYVQYLQLAITINAKNGLFMVLELNCMYREKKWCKAQYTYSLHKAQATKYTGSWFAVSVRKHLKYGLQYLANTHILYQGEIPLLISMLIFSLRNHPLYYFTLSNTRWFYSSIKSIWVGTLGLTGPIWQFLFNNCFNHSAATIYY